MTIIISPCCLEFLLHHPIVYVNARKYCGAFLICCNALASQHGVGVSKQYTNGILVRDYSIRDEAQLGSISSNDLIIYSLEKGIDVIAIAKATYNK